MSDFGGPGPSRQGRGGNGNRRPWRQKSHGGRGRGAGAGCGGRGRGTSAARGNVNAGPGILGERPALISATPEQQNILQEIVNNNTDGSHGHSNRNNARSNQKNDKGRGKRDRPMGFKMLEEISKSDSVDIIEKINQQKAFFTLLLDTPVDKKKSDIFFLVLELITNVWKTSFEESKKLLLLDLCNTKFIDHLQLYLMHLPYTVSREDKYFNKYYWTREKEFWSHFMNFCECLINVSPATAVHKCGALIEATSKSCLEGLKEKQGFELPEEYTARMTKIRESLKVCDQVQIQNQRRLEGIDEVGEPLESFRELSVLPSGSELLERRPFLRPNVVEGAYADVEHYLDVQFRLLREDCFGPLREGIHQFIEEPKKRKYDHIRVYKNVKFLEPYASKQKIGSIVLLDESTMKMFKRVNWAHSKRFLFGSLVVFTKDNCKSFLVGTILERDEKFLNKRQLPVNIVNCAMGSNLYNDDPYIMIECEVYFEPYYHVLKALQEPSFPEHLAMSKYIVDVEKVPEKPAYLTPGTIYQIQNKDAEDVNFIVLEDHSWPLQTELSLNNTQYEAYKLALTHEFAVIQGPPGTGKTYLGVKVAETLLKYAPFPKIRCCMLVICYTNHALDQFLEALLPITKSLARIGGRSRNEALNQFNINNLRRKVNSSYYHERRIELKTQISALDHAQARVDALNSGVLSYKSIVAYNEECKILENFYRGRNIKDVLKHWLFENVEDFQIDPTLLEQVENDQPDEPENNNAEVDDDIFARDEIDFDDLDDDGSLAEKPGYDSVTTSFSLSDKEEEIKSLLRRFQDLQNRGSSRYELKELENEICHVYSEVKLFKDMLEHRSRAPRIRLTNALDLTTVPRVERWSLYFKWANVAMEDVKKKIKQIEERLRSAAVAYEEARMMVDLSVLKRTRVVGMTTSGAARLRKLLAEIAPPIVVVEEAAEVLESHIVTSLTKSCQHLILIGDHQQLRPSAAYLRLARHYELEVSLFERMIRNGVHSRRLGVQHRMRPEIAALVAPTIYPDLQNHLSVEDFPPVRGVTHNLFFFSHDYREQCEDDSSSRTNTQEADLVLRLANYLMQQGYKPEEVTILAAYSGQLFYMRKQRSLYDHLSNVKITVLDNYQGEESKIILLSLVRNNDNDSIGFLGTENRICVALSRAREGFFIFGNIDLLKRKSELWKKIAATLEKNGSLGTSLKLKCDNHNGQITTITSVSDFVKVPEGGCLLDCKYNLPCGHACPRVCHAYDLVHAKIQCTKDCERKICQIEGHKCPFKCAKECQPCKRLVEKSLPCGHNKAVPCFKEPGDPSIQCTAPVDVTLPDCGHQATKECYMKTSDVKCKDKCPNSRLKCGHACRRTCHVNDDPDHLRYTCLKPCPKAKKGCTANLEGDLGEHKCLRSCFEECIECNVQVIKKRSGCTHSKRVACHEDVNAKPCREKCARSLPCGHHCKKLCFEKCGDCKQKTKKPVPGCNHEIVIECGSEPTRDLCRLKCERIMTCGHACQAQCGEPCDMSKCTEITPRSFASPCGHNVQLPCNVSRQATQTGSVSVETLLSACTAPCGALLRCGHVCGGSCAGCRQGRLHQPCAARCHQLNICGHRCEEPCNQVCPPCRRKCEVKCPHSPCSNLCGAPCTMCSETPCDRSCVHSVCVRACGAPCSRAPCSEPCPLALPCGHPCRGLCGEPCPPACRLCDPEGFPTDLLGDPYDDDEKLIQLQDCPHIFDVDTLDNLMNSEGDTVQLKACPWCRQPIVNTYRYKDLINKLLKNDINPIKAKVYGTDSQRRTKKLEMVNKVSQLADAHRRTILASKEWSNALHVVIKIIKRAQNDRKISLLQLEMNDIYMNFLDTVGQYYMKYKAAHLSELDVEMKTQVKLLCNVLTTNSHKISEQQQLDLDNELKRMNSMIQLAKILSHESYKSSKTNEIVMQASAAANDAVLSWRVFEEGKGVECLEKLENAVKLSGIASKEERAMIVKVIGLKAGHWYKCPNGHFYCIADCGGAMVLSKCPDCGAAIGGQGHRLTAGNQHAGEMDGSRFAAWSQEANNMANFNFD
ncbi:NFX1-type zinc finger-containing protein 1-like [Cydia splendana]|uniref:NFX1-type zinc finger-containing protein 1-like n=1 Tax=Cydia splendana TaxID=1100963 RepID=UPI00300CFF0D